ncbi:related to Linoleate 10R-lipoxygenase COP4 [Armillaria ostoyae]|uniref:Terpene synthase n=1 Tax=Armillaria ostoyae TaxID=47428 RepID=A0A284QTG2_ARMOS|nr:related to Linoleate 10R-lipoxygenase COP4 [Armillaria ostoyae]
MATQTRTLSTFRLPNFEATFSVLPDNGLNPYHEEARAESRAWIDNYNKTFCGPEMRTFMSSCNFELISSFCYPYAHKACLRATMDLNNVLWLYDEFTDTESGADAQKSGEILIRTLREADFDDGSWLCHMMKDFRERHIDRVGSNIADRFIRHLCTYIRIIGKEAELRDRSEVLNIHDYVALRRETGAVHDDPVFQTGCNAAMDLVCWANDIYSYNMEQAKGLSCANIVTVIMKSKQLDLQSAVDFINEYCEALLDQYEEAKEVLSARPEEGYSDAVLLLKALGDWVRGNDEWSFATERYFGKEGREIRKSRVVILREPSTNKFSLTE